MPINSGIFRPWTSLIPPKIAKRFDKTIKDCKRVLKVSRKPDKQEYLEFSKIVAIGIAIIGVVGFIIVLIGELIGL